MKILNLYAGIGGNRKLWTDCEVTAVEYDAEIAKVYQHNHPSDTVIVGDAHKYLLDHFKEFDFIWASPPCPTHSRLRTSHPESIVYPEMSLYQEIILLTHWFKGLFCVENVIPYYDSLITPTATIHRHCFWANFHIKHIDVVPFRACDMIGERMYLEERIGLDVNIDAKIDKRKVLRNCVLPEVGKAIKDSVVLHHTTNAMRFAGSPALPNGEQTLDLFATSPC